MAQGARKWRNVLAAKSPRKSVAAVGEGTRLSDLAYTKVLESLFDRRLPTGSFVSQSRLVELTGVPVAPLRDALRVLEAEGILTIHPRTGIQFVKPGAELTRSTYQFRGIIESAAVAVFAETAADAEIDAIDARHRCAVAAVERDGVTPALLLELEDLENLLHGSIVAGLNNPLIENNYRRVRNYLLLIRLDRRLTPPLVLRSLKEHLAILGACRRRNATDAVAALQTHFSAALQRALGLY
jgi:DNA-binding GntR family transcriptional regulator